MIKETLQDYERTNTFLALHERPVVALALVQAGVRDILLLLVFVQPRVLVLLEGARIPAVPVRGSLLCFTHTLLAVLMD